MAALFGGADKEDWVGGLTPLGGAFLALQLPCSPCRRCRLPLTLSDEKLVSGSVLCTAQTHWPLCPWLWSHRSHPSSSGHKVCAPSSSWSWTVGGQSCPVCSPPGPPTVTLVGDSRGHRTFLENHSLVEVAARARPLCAPVPGADVTGHSRPGLRNLHVAPAHGRLHGSSPAQIGAEEAQASGA